MRSLILSALLTSFVPSLICARVLPVQQPTSGGTSSSVETTGTCNGGGQRVDLVNWNTAKVNSIVCVEEVSGSTRTATFLKITLPAKAVSGPEPRKHLGCTREGSTIRSYHLAWSNVGSDYMPDNLVSNPDEALILWNDRNQAGWAINRHATKTVFAYIVDSTGRSEQANIAPGEFHFVHQPSASATGAKFFPPYRPGYCQ